MREKWATGDGVWRRVASWDTIWLCRSYVKLYNGITIFLTIPYGEKQSETYVFFLAIWYVCMVHMCLLYSTFYMIDMIDTTNIHLKACHVALASSLLFHLLTSNHSICMHPFRLQFQVWFRHLAMCGAGWIIRAVAKHNTRGTDDLTPVTGESVCETEKSLSLSCRHNQHINFIGLAL